MKVDGGELDWRGPEFFFVASQETEKAMRRACIETQGEAKKLIGGAGSGRKYRRGKRYHRASAPGEPPARDTGTLAASVEYEVSRRGDMIQGSVGSNLDLVRQKGRTAQPDYGSYLEFGTRKMDPRPWLAPTLKRMSSKIRRIFMDALKG